MNPSLKHYLSNPKQHYAKKLSSSSSLDRASNHNALNLFHQAATRIPAYKQFLKDNHIKPSLIKSITD